MNNEPIKMSLLSYLAHSVRQVKQKIVHGSRTYNINCSTFVLAFEDLQGLHVTSPSSNYEKNVVTVLKWFKNHVNPQFS